MFNMPGPQFSTHDEHPSTSICKGCDKDCKVPWGLAEHEKSCPEMIHVKEACAKVIKEIHAQGMRDSDCATTLLPAISHDDKSVVDLVEKDKDEEEKVDGRRGAPHRRQYSTKFKCRMIKAFDDLSKDAGQGALTMLEDTTKISKSILAKWVKDRVKLENLAKAEAGRKGRGHVSRVLFRSPRGPSLRFAAAEEVVMGKFEAARAKRKAVSGRTLRLWMAAAVRGLYPSSSKVFVASQTWLSRFVNRNGLRVRRAKNREELFMSERVPKVAQFHRSLQHFVSQGTMVDDVFGAVHPNNVYNVDQSPICLSMSSNVTCAKAGAKVIGISEKGASDKRFATITVCLRLSGNVGQRKPQPPIGIIFKGAGKRISEQERSQWNKNVFVQFSEKARTTAATIRDGADHFKERVDKDSFKRPGPVLLFMDNLGVQTEQSFRMKLTSKGITPWFFPPNCTDLVQPADQHVAVHLKNLMGQILERKLMEDNKFFDEYIGFADGTYPIWKCRVLLTNILSEAWETLCLIQDFTALGLRTGCVMPRAGVDRSNLQAIVINGCPDYDFEKIAASSPVSQGEPIESAPNPVAQSSGGVTKSTSNGSSQNPKKAKVQAESDNSSSESDSDDSCSDEDENNSMGTDISDDNSSENELASTTCIDQKEHCKNSDDEIDDDDDVDFDDSEIDETYADDTRDPCTPTPEPPNGYCLEPTPNKMPQMSKLRGKKVFWAIPL